MKCVILAGGYGTRLSEETNLKPKPMVEIGGRPILWHIMKIYAHHNIKEFIVLCGYKSEIIKEYFFNYHVKNSDLEIDLKQNKVSFLNKFKEDWKITLLETGTNTMTGGRLRFIKPLLEEGEQFCMTYGDGVGNIDIKKLINFHKKNKKLATVTLVQPFGRWGKVKTKKNSITEFSEKPKGDGAWVSGGFFVLNKNALSTLKNSGDVWEKEHLSNLASKGQLSGYKHNGFWKAMDTLNDKNFLENEWRNKPKWKIWK